MHIDAILCSAPLETMVLQWFTKADLLLSKLQKNNSSLEQLRRNLQKQNPTSLYPTTKGAGHAEVPLQEWKAEGMENLHHTMEDEDLLQMAGDLIQIVEDPLDDQGVLQMTEGDMGHLEKMADHLHMESEILVPGGLLQMIDTEKAPQEREEDLPLMTGTEMVHHLGIEVEVLHLMIGMLT